MSTIPIKQILVEAFKSVINGRTQSVIVVLIATFLLVGATLVELQTAETAVESQLEFEAAGGYVFVIRSSDMQKLRIDPVACDRLADLELISAAAPISAETRVTVEHIGEIPTRSTSKGIDRLVSAIHGPSLKPGHAYLGAVVAKTAQLEQRTHLMVRTAEDLQRVEYQIAPLQNLQIGYGSALFIVDPTVDDFEFCLFVAHPQLAKNKELLSGLAANFKVGPLIVQRALAGADLHQPADEQFRFRSTKHSWILSLTLFALLLLAIHWYRRAEHGLYSLIGMTNIDLKLFTLFHALLKIALAALIAVLTIIGIISITAYTQYWFAIIAFLTNLAALLTAAVTTSLVSNNTKSHESALDVLKDR